MIRFLLIAISIVLNFNLLHSQLSFNTGFAWYINENEPGLSTKIDFSLKLNSKYKLTYRLSMANCDKKGLSKRRNETNGAISYWDSQLNNPAAFWQLTEKEKSLIEFDVNPDKFSSKSFTVYFGKAIYSKNNYFIFTNYGLGLHAVDITRIKYAFIPEYLFGTPFRGEVLEKTVIAVFEFQSYYDQMCIRDRSLSLELVDL